MFWTVVAAIIFIYIVAMFSPYIIMFLGAVVVTLIEFIKGIRNSVKEQKTQEQEVK